MGCVCVSPNTNSKKNRPLPTNSSEITSLMNKPKKTLNQEENVKNLNLNCIIENHQNTTILKAINQINGEESNN